MRVDVTNDGKVRVMIGNPEFCTRQFDDPKDAIEWIEPKISRHRKRAEDYGTKAEMLSREADHLATVVDELRALRRLASR